MLFLLEYLGKQGKEGQAQELCSATGSISESHQVSFISLPGYHLEFKLIALFMN